MKHAHSARLKRQLCEAERRGVLVAPEGLCCVAPLGKFRVRVVCGRTARYLTDEFHLPVCGLHHPRLLVERLFRDWPVTARAEAS